jgi:protein gp37
MGVDTAIAWTDHTFNSWWGCTNVSPGCDNCYAEAFAKRVGQDVWGKDSGRRFFGDKHWAEPLKWKGRVFCASMADVFEMNPVLTQERARLWRLIDATPHLTWQLLTKRPENVIRLAPSHWLQDWPEHVWLGTTAEDQVRANIRVPRLLAVKGVKVRFLSCEPLLGSVTLAPWLHEGIGWVICGGESGPRHRLMELANARTIRDECEKASVPFFFKQIGGRTPKAGGHELDGRVHQEFPEVAT